MASNAARTETTRRSCRRIFPVTRTRPTQKASIGSSTKRRPPKPIRRPPCSGLKASTRASTESMSTEDASGVLLRKAPRPAEMMNKAPSVAGPTRRRGSSETVPPVPLGIRRRIRPSAISHTARPMSVPRVDLPTTAMTRGSAETNSAPRTPKLLPTPISAPTRRPNPPPRQEEGHDVQSVRVLPGGRHSVSVASLNLRAFILIRDIQKFELQTVE